MSGVAENKRMRRRVVKILKPLHAIPVENSAHPGTSDINFKGGWLELKELEAWPKDRTTVVPVPHFTPQQRLFLTMRDRTGGFADVLLKVRRSWWLINGAEAADGLGELWTQSDIKVNSYCYWEKKLDEKEFLTEILYQSGLHTHLLL
jgi:hypothetical protein